MNPNELYETAMDPANRFSSESRSKMLRRPRDLPRADGRAGRTAARVHREARAGSEGPRHLGQADSSQQSARNRRLADGSQDMVQRTVAGRRNLVILRSSHSGRPACSPRSADTWECRC